MTADKKVIAVFGATGAQGGSVARSLLLNPGFHVRCITRNATSAKAQDLANLGAEVVQAHGFKNEELLSAFCGCWAAFVNTNSEDPELTATGRNDFDLGSNVVRCAARAGVQHLVYSSAPSPAVLTNGAVTLPALDLKWRVEQVALSESFKTVTPITAAWYMENWFHDGFSDLFGGFPTIPDSEGYLTYRIPPWGGKEDFPWISITDDFGDLVHGVLLRPLRWNRRPIQGTSAIASSEEVVRTFKSVTGKKARHIPLEDPNDMKTLGEHWREQERNEFFFTPIRDGEYFCNGPTEIETSTELKKAAFEAKGRQGRETLMTVAEFFKREFVNV
ncbi:hypothetical protein EYZ11_005798 [Aspergillus tanneri]|uniref:NmrA-like domain-containing protein 1 n=1 Tax=Aspergillus tanneri TaxID=1220188 RepID=A0A4S3JJJ0_9EURO|nr:NmrA-like domain-containing protein 1 [Aspergillus tanneri]KAA8649575.1 NmrA-like domain-containing protein 1 [Aspergillus tanneri]THC94718.1 hypothetical protein EYZ11_005798 [Aspergillus tanneri]